MGNPSKWLFITTPLPSTVPSLWSKRALDSSINPLSNIFIKKESLETYYSNLSATQWQNCKPWVYKGNRVFPFHFMAEDVQVRANANPSLPIKPLIHQPCLMSPLHCTLQHNQTGDRSQSPDDQPRPNSHDPPAHSTFEDTPNTDLYGALTLKLFCIRWSTHSRV